MGRELATSLRTAYPDPLLLPQRTRAALDILTSLTQRWTRILALDDAEAPPVLADASSPDQFPAFSVAPSPDVPDWEEAIEILGSSHSAFALTSYGWALLLQGLNSDTERCLQAALHA